MPSAHGPYGPGEMYSRRASLRTTVARGSGESATGPRNLCNRFTASAAASVRARMEDIVLLRGCPRLCRDWFANQCPRTPGIAGAGRMPARAARRRRGRDAKAGRGRGRAEAARGEWPLAQAGEPPRPERSCYTRSGPHGRGVRRRSRNRALRREYVRRESTLREYRPGASARARHGGMDAAAESGRMPSGGRRIGRTDSRASGPQRRGCPRFRTQGRGKPGARRMPHRGGRRGGGGRVDAGCGDEPPSP